MSTKHYPDVDPNPDFAKIEEKILARWKEDHTFSESIAERPAHIDQHTNEFIFYDGPPFANGLPHYGHLLTGYVKDVFARYQTMRGHRVERRFGWDCHGLPAEMGAEKELGISGRNAIINYGIGKFNDYCRTSVMKYTHEWEHYVTRQARWVDFKNDYKTMDRNYMESVLWAFKSLYDKGLIYEAYRVMPYSWAAETPLSNFETKLDNSYRERADKAVTVAFELNEVPAGAPKASKYYILAWTTTPWTLPSNLALAVNKELNYQFIIKDSVCYILGSNAHGKLNREIGTPTSVKDMYETTPTGEISGADLLNLTYKPLFPYFANHPNSFRILDGSSFVTDTDGTGIVHMAPGFGEDDQKICEANGIELVVPVDGSGKFTSEVSDYQGMQVFDAIDPIIKDLKAKGAWIKTEQILHNYPHCWRTDTPLIYRALPSWYVEVTKFRDRAVELNKQINWIPQHVRDGQMGHMLATAPDWSISRNRFWGTPIPIWKSDNPNNKELYVFGSIKELEAFFGKEVTELHRPNIDALTKPDPLDPKYTLRRVEDVFDCWFESGSMPFAQVHYPFENKAWFEEHFPADFITEYVGQTRGWFNTLIMLSTALFDKPPFKNCICHGVVLDAETGLKYSKRLKNYKDPLEVINQFGADALRWMMLASPVMRGQDLMVDPEGKFIRDVVRLAIKPIWNAYNFFCLYANADGIEAKILRQKGQWRIPSHRMDQYILAKLAHSIAVVQVALDAYDTPSACQEIVEFFDALNNWYIRRSKPRFWKSERDQEKQDAYDTLYTVLHVMLRVAAPLLPLTTEEMFEGLTSKDKSVHLSNWPDCDNLADVRNPEIVLEMDAVRDICNAALGIRNARNLRVRLPLAKLTLVTEGKKVNPEYFPIIEEEVNVKRVEISGEFDAVASRKLQIHFPVLGKRLPEKMKQIIPASKKGDWKLLPDGRIEIAREVLEKNEFDMLLEAKDSFKQSAQALASNDGLVILDTHVTPELEKEGYARDLVRLIQQARKDADLLVTDRIRLRLRVSPTISDVLATYRDYISEQVLAAEITEGDMQGCTFITNETIENEEVSIGFQQSAVAA